VGLGEVTLCFAPGALRHAWCEASARRPRISNAWRTLKRPILATDVQGLWLSPKPLRINFVTHVKAAAPLWIGILAARGVIR
jgi:hypothetical protein